MSQSPVDSFVVDWKRKVEMEKDHAAAFALIAPKMTFFSPAVHKPATDREYVLTILRWIFDLVEGFHYTGNDLFDRARRKVALEFAGHVRDRASGKLLAVEGVDFITLDGDGKISELKVMIRPLNALTCVAAEMRARFKALYAERAAGAKL